ncbi:hypothetical protein NDU88_004818 [Pleurodeles waltl]|uniref:Uncharacterized protein n=1 Tax=Pleurodeles waltl TaxID=8319 RepID=A0AAV7KZF9_PLEWA|nr:hypothetical protein NDU88_004818 [Pleurodeles waltl]
MDSCLRVPVEQGDQVQKSQAARRWADAQEMPAVGAKKLLLGRRTVNTAGTTRSRDFPFGGWIPHALESRAEVFSRRMDANKPCYTQIVRLAFLDAAGAQEGPEGRKLDLQREGTSSKTKSPH